MKHSSKKWYSIIAAIMLTGFLLIITVGTLNLVLQEMQDGKWRQDYMKAYAAAEGGVELVLLGIKQQWFGVFLQSENSEILWDDVKTPSISYDSQSRKNAYTGSLEAFETDIIPLFWKDETGTVYSTDGNNFRFRGDNFVWNLVNEQGGGMSGIGDFTSSTSGNVKTVENGVFTLTNMDVNSFISQSNSGEKYLIVYNPNNESQEYILETSWDFTPPKIDIIASAKIGKYRQNIETNLNNSEYLGILKYSLYSGE